MSNKANQKNKNQTSSGGNNEVNSRLEEDANNLIVAKNEDCDEKKLLDQEVALSQKSLSNIDCCQGLMESFIREY